MILTCKNLQMNQYLVLVSFKTVVSMCSSQYSPIELDKQIMRFFMCRVAGKYVHDLFD